MSFPNALSFLCCHVPQQPPGVAFDPRQWKGSQQQPEGEAKDWGGGQPPPSLTCVLMRMAPMDGISK